MSSFTFDSNILIDTLRGIPQARTELRRAAEFGKIWVSRAVWIEVLSKGQGTGLKRAEVLLSGFGIDEIDGEIAARAASMRRERQRLKAMDAIILATAQIRGRVLVTRNTKDFPAEMPGIRVPYQL
ncbi:MULTISPECIES: type II toxin-antitoxin system VapC family toxin [Blastomonas]|uniref:Ribonuclease VapC n=1 Tax=Blastomonas fulva TaxID=1550728 RepID=A0ABN5B479_9SPHN|nr:MULTISPECIES: type II toxin-antitoxin system VapC family toxin [Blastomonas]ASR51631.1 VapC toxin family PIN domain ribonuclease [Blastomonas fulva]KPF76840.1 twitching motility protein PilT [Blastomonas sp. AAP25]MDM7929259.1 type II toxin-antitoxin system VapC family toxin [Blastomonas fulva]MDM7966029.1 type II toxin-antitoxin system VapC family toxin [Blastomonas fulva]